VQGSARQDPALRDVLLLALAVGGLVMCLVLMFEGMRAVMDIGGYCAEGGPYVIETHCPEGATPALLLGIFGLFGFGGLGMYAGAKVGGYGWVPMLAWVGLFASLGWNFLDYGLFNPPAGEGIVWGWLIPGVMLEVMAWAPVVFVVVAIRDARRGAAGGVSSSRAAAIVPNALRGPGQPARRAAAPAPASPPTPPTPPRRGVCAARAIACGAAITDAAATTPMDPDARTAGVIDAGGEFSEGTQALLDRLERLADMRDRGLLGAEEYETAKDAIMRELEARS
jgi:hypothetical protein